MNAKARDAAFRMARPGMAFEALAARDSPATPADIGVRFRRATSIRGRQRSGCRDREKGRRRGRSLL
jgi:hypothetical protein